MEAVSRIMGAAGFIHREWRAGTSACAARGFMAEVRTLFWDNGGVILTNGWDRGSRQKAVEKFGLDWADFEDRHELMLHAFECGEATLDEYIQRTVFYRGRAFT